MIFYQFYLKYRIYILPISLTVIKKIESSLNVTKVLKLVWCSVCGHTLAVLKSAWLAVDGGAAPPAGFQYHSSNGHEQRHPGRLKDNTQKTFNRQCK